MEKEKVTALHIGLTKAGSTFLQGKVFPIIFPEVNFSPFGDVQATAQMVQNFLSNSELPEYGTTTRFLSSEGFSCIQWRCYKQNDAWENFCKFIVAAKKLQPPVPKILFVVRDHESWLKSEYIDRLKKDKPTASFSGFVNSFSEHDLSWESRIIALKQFPSLIILQPDLMRYPIETVELIFDFWGRKLTPQKKRSILNSKRRVNSNPKTDFSLLVTKYAYKFSAKSAYEIKKYAKRFGIDVNESFLNPHYIRDLTAKYSNQLPIGKNLDKDLRIPRKWRNFFYDDWEKTLQFVTRPNHKMPNE